ncbi:MAG: HAD-IIIC family phosphatase [Gammaproteobacteria bacterium]|nr:HAD-IIIC family phosphatase [Gammaproteobacteria bacterium]
MKQGEKKIKCVVWDLDNTLWDGTLLEGDQLSLKENAVNIIKTLDGRGILNSIASKNEYNLAMDKLKNFGLDSYFLYPQINWNAKHFSVKQIAESINIGADSLAFIDDQEFELDEVRHSLPEVCCINSENMDDILQMPEMNPRFITQDSRIRRQMYQSDIKRKEIEDNFEGPQQDFLASLAMKFTILNATENDLQRAEELTIRTHQLNTTGYTYSYEELRDFINSDKHLLLISSLDDKYGTYGKIGLSLIEKNEEFWNIKLLLMSCRVMSRGVGNVMITHIMSMAKTQKVRLLAELIPTEKNRMMYMTYKFSGFKEIKNDGKIITFENELTNIPKISSYIALEAGIDLNI